MVIADSEDKGGRKHTTGMGFYKGSTKYPIYLEFDPSYAGLGKENASKLEKQIKEDYLVGDYDDRFSEKPGYEILNKTTNQRYFFSPNARLTLETRYLEKNDKKQITENVLDLLTRVAVNIASADLKYDTNVDIEATAKTFLDVMIAQEFMPNTPTLCNAGRSLQQLSACFVLPIEDYVATDDIGEDPEKQGNGIYDTLRNVAIIHKSGGGTGFNFSRLRPKYDRICTTFGSSSGPVSFIKSFDATTDAINQGGFRRGANMGILDYTHPDIFEFVHEKTTGTLTNFNLSVGLDSEFMKKVKNKEYFTLINPKDQFILPLEDRIYKAESLIRERKYKDDPELSPKEFKEKREYLRMLDEIKPSLILSEDRKNVINYYNQAIVGEIGMNNEIKISANALFDYITECAWKTGCPGVVFIDKLNDDNPTPHVSRIEATNPCGEQPLLPYEACNLGSVNLAKCIKVEGSKKMPDLVKLSYLTRVGVHFLDNVIDMNKYPFKKVYLMAKGNRKIGLGVMGWADMLTQLNIPYDSNEALDLAEKVAKFITQTAKEESEKLAEKRGLYRNWKGSIHDPESEYAKDKTGRRLRNATVTTIAPTGPIGMLSDTSGGIEPIFALYFNKVCMDGRELKYRNKEFEGWAKESGVNLESIIDQIKRERGLQKLELPENIKSIFKTAHDISPEWHIKMQIAFQKYIDNAVSKTINLPNTATVGQIKEIYSYAWKYGCKGITVFREGSKDSQVLVKEEKKPVLVHIKVERPIAVSESDGASKYKVKRARNKDSLHVTITDKLYVDRKNNRAYLLPNEIFQNRAPLGEETTVDFQQEGMDRTEMLKGQDPDYVEYIKRWKSASSDDEEGLGPGRIRSKHHAVGLMFETHLLNQGVAGYDQSGTLINLIRKKDLEEVTDENERELILNGNKQTGKEIKLNIAGRNADFKCNECGSTDYMFESGCHSPKCKHCGWSLSDCS